MTPPTMPIPKDPVTGEEIIGKDPKRSLSVAPPEMLASLMSQFSDKFAFIRESGQNALDSAATTFSISLEQIDPDHIVVCAKDDGCGMDHNIAQRLTTMFDSPKEGKDSALGQFGIGRLSGLSLPGAERIEWVTVRADATEAYTLSYDNAGYAEGEQPAAIPATAARRELGTQSGTRVRITCAVSDSKKFVDDALAYARQELRWVAMAVQFKATPLKDDFVAIDESVSSQDARIPGALSKTYRFKLAESGDSGVVDLGITPDVVSRYTPDPKCDRHSLTAGGLILERGSHLDWLGGKSFNFYNLLATIESAQGWNYPIGRNLVYRDARFRRVVPKVFQSIICANYLKTLLDDIAKPVREQLSHGYGTHARQCLLDAIDMQDHGYDLPKEIYAAPLFAVHGAYDRWVSLAHLEAQPKIYWSTRKPEFGLLRLAANEEADAGAPIVVDCYTTPWPGRQVLEKRFAGRMQEVKGEHLILADELGDRELLEQGRALRRLLPMNASTLRAIMAGHVHIARIEAARLGRLDGVLDTKTRAAAVSERMVHFNLACPAIRTMLDVGRDEAHREYVGVVLLRELLLAKNLNIPERLRADLLRQATRNGGWKDDADERRPRSYGQHTPAEIQAMLERLMAAGKAPSEDVVV